MAALALLPLVVALGIIATVVAAGSVARVDRRVTRIARVLFSRFVDSDVERERLLESAYVAETYQAYATKTHLYTILLSVAGGIVGAYLVGGIIVAIPAIGQLLSGLPNAMTAVLGRPSTWSVDLPRSTYLTILGISGVIGALFSGVTTFSLRWQLLESRAEARRRRINESLARTVAFLYALSRGGMSFPAVMAILADNREVYGETAAEVSVAVREMELFGTDMVNAIGRMTQRTPSEEFKTFGENLSSVLQSGQSLPQFLHDQYERYQEDAEDRQEEVLELLATIAEAYVTVLVAGTLFLITILLVFGLTTTDTLWIIQMLAYLAIPLANVGFIVFLTQRLSILGIGNLGADVTPGGGTLFDTATPTAEGAPTTDGGHATTIRANFERLAAYDHLERYQRVLHQPARAVFHNPTMLLYVTVPVAVIVTLVRLPSALTGVGVNVRVLDDLLIQATLFVMGTYAIVRFYHKRRLARIEAATPELLERLASLNEAGMSVVESVNRVRGTDLGVLSGEVERIWADIELGANVEDALVRFGRRVSTTPITRAVTLLSNAMRASGNIGNVLRIAATQARADLRMKRKRRRQMLTYLVVIYVSFAVFLVIIVAVQEVLVPALPDTVPTPPSDNRLGVDAGQFTRFGSVNKAAYTLVFFHTAMIQAAFSGLIGGQIGEGAVKDGVKHAAIMLTIAYVVFLALSGPVASMNLEQQPADAEVTIETVSLSHGGYVVVHEHTSTGPVVGTSEYLPAGTSKEVTIPLEKGIEAESTIVVVPHLDTDDDKEFGYNGGDVDRPYPPGRDAVAVKATAT